MQFEIEINKKDFSSLIKLKGRLESSLCESMKKRLIEYIYEGNIYLIFSLYELNYISGLATGLIKSLADECESMGGLAFVIAPSEERFSDFKEPLFKIFRTEEEVSQHLENIMFR